MAAPKELLQHRFCTGPSASPGRQRLSLPTRSSQGCEGVVFITGAAPLALGGATEKKESLSKSYRWGLGPPNTA